jgi:DNA-binding response OmpR family regulator
MPATKGRILVIDDEAAIRDSLRMILEYEDYAFSGASSGQEGLALVQRDRPDLVLLDIKMPAMDGMEVLRKLKRSTTTLPVVMISGPRHDRPPRSRRRSRRASTSSTSR